MSIASPFLFDDREYFFYGEITTQEVEYVDRKLQSHTKAFVTTIFTVATISTIAFINVKSTIASTPARIVIKSQAKVGEDNDDDLKRTFAINREFLGLKQKQIAQILGLSESTIEKFEQGVYLSQAPKTAELISLFNEWVGVLQQFHGERKFIVRPFIKVKMNALGDISPLQYAEENPGQGLYDLIGLERKMYG